MSQSQSLVHTADGPDGTMIQIITSGDFTIEITLKDGEKNGPMTIYTKKKGGEEGGNPAEDKKIVCQISFQKDKKSGPATFYDQSGVIVQRQCVYANDELNGLCQMFDDMGRLSMKTNYVQDLENGIREVYDPTSGALVMKAGYKKGKLDGDYWIYFRGKQQTHHLYKDGMLVSGP